MFEFLEKLRARPVGQKKLIAFTGAFFVAGVMFTMWLLVWFPDFRFKNAQENAVADKSVSPWSTFTEAAGTGISHIGEQISNMKEAANVFQSGADYYTATSTSSTTEVGE